MDILTTSGLTVGYTTRKHSEPRRVLTDLNLALPEGTLTLLIGANGSGKSTLLRTLSGAQPAISGEIALNGRPAESLSLRERARLLALVYTDRTGGGGLTVRELVALGRQPYTGFIGRLSADDKAAVERALDAVGISHKAEAYTATLSDGERQKAMIARALAQETPLIILDEPTAFLDIASRLEVMQLLATLTRNENKTILLSTHDLASAITVADRLWVVAATKHTIKEGPTRQLIADGTMDCVFPDRPVRFNPSIHDYSIHDARFTIHDARLTLQS